MVYRSADDGDSWTRVLEVDHAGGYNTLNYDTKVFTNKIFVVADQNIYVSGDLGVSWDSIIINDYFQGLQVIGDTVLLIHDRWDTDSQILSTTDMGATWVDVTPDGLSPERLLKQGDRLIALSWGGQIYYSDDRGNSWVQSGHPISDLDPSVAARIVLATDSLLIAGESSENFFVTRDLGQTWKLLIPGVVTTYWKDFFVKDGFLYGWASVYTPEIDNKNRLMRTPLQPILDRLPPYSATTGLLKGRIFKDLNGNCQYDPTDLPVAGKSIRSQPYNRYFVTADDGTFQEMLPVGTYELAIQGEKYYLPACGDTIATLLVSADSTTTQDFVFAPKPDIRDLAVTLTALTPARRGFLVKYKIKARNVGTEPLENTQISFDFPAAQLVFEQTNPAGILQGNSVRFDLGTLAINEEREFWLEFTVSVAGSPIGTSLLLNAVGSHAHTDFAPADNLATLTQIVTGSYDPNDKSASPDGFLPPDNQQIEYKIRFQNTGTDTAFTIVVRDTLEANFDPFSVRTIDASHPYQFFIEGSHILKWVFSNVLLPDSTVNESGSHGFVRFSVSPRTLLPIGAGLSNSAAIFFDFNPPVITNTVVSEVGIITTSTHQPNAGPKQVWSTYPVPFDDVLQLQCVTEESVSANISLLDLNGRSVMEISGQKQFAKGKSTLSLQIPDLPAGIYWLRVVSGSESWIEKVTKLN